jgi:plastocyanin
MNRLFTILFLIAIVICSAAAETFVVNVAANKYDPATVKGKVNDVVQFKFAAGRNSVVEASNSTSCIPLAGGFDSTVKNAGDMYELKLTDAKQNIYFYSSINGACAAGMRGSISVDGAKSPGANGSDPNNPDGGSNGGGGGDGGDSSAASSSMVSYGVLILSAIVAIFVGF